MPATSSSSTACIWFEPTQAPFVQAVVDRLSLEVVACGCPVASREARPSFPGQSFDDLRACLSSIREAAAAGAPSPTIIWLAAPPDVATDSDDRAALLDLLRECAGMGIHVLTSTPLPASVLELRDAAADNTSRPDESLIDVIAPRDLPRFVPRFRLSRMMLDAAEYLVDFGTPRVCLFESRSSAAQGALGARLLDAFDTIVWLFGEPEQVDASIIPARAASSVRSVAAPAAGSLSTLTGSLTANVRYSDGRAVSLFLSDAGPDWRRSLTLIGDGSHEKAGRLTVHDSSVEWIGADGALLESSAPTMSRKRSAPRTDDNHAIAALAEQIDLILKSSPIANTPIDQGAVLACAGAALLSARTGVPESPGTIRGMLRT